MKHNIHSKGATPYIVAVLSTDNDLSDVRKVVIERLRNLHFQVRAFEESDYLLHPGLHSHETCLANLQDVDIAILIIDRRYGGLFKDTGVSITEMEWNVARKLNKPLIPCIRQSAFDHAHAVKALLKDTQAETQDKTSKGLIAGYFESNKTIEFLEKVRKADHDNYCIFFNDAIDLKRKLVAKLQTLTQYFLRLTALRQVDMLGSQRTAAPIDLSLRELLDHEYYVQPTCCLRGAYSSKQIDLPKELIKDLSTNKSALVLGTPGQGKTLSLFSAFRQAVCSTQVGSPRIPFFVTFADVLRDGGGIKQLLVGIQERTGKKAYPTTDLQYVQPMFFIDAIDEAINELSFSPESFSGTDVFSVLHIAACRTFEFESLLSTNQLTARYNRIWELQPWKLDLEVKQYLEAINKSGAPESTLRAIREHLCDEQIARLCTTPLMLRMVVYVLSEPRELKPRNKASLYHEFFGIWINRESSRLGNYQCFRSHCLDAWKAVAWHLYKIGDTVPWSQPLVDEALHGLTYEGIQYDERFWILFNRSSLGLISYIHYSYLEFLVALHVVTWIRESDLMARKAFSHHLSREIRRFLVGLVEAAGDHRRIVPILAKCISQDEQGVQCGAALQVNNQIFYLLGHLSDQLSLETLQQAGRMPLDAYSKSSLYWALIRRGDQTTIVTYLDELLHSEDDANGYDVLNRGYHLFYYGEWKGRQEPPYVDGGESSWERTRVALIKNLSTSDQMRVRHRSLDLYTLLRFLETRENSQVSKAERPIINQALQECLNCDQLVPIGIQLRERFEKLEVI